MTMLISTEAEARKPAVSFVWNEAGFGRHDAAAWRDAGWSDPSSAAEWSETCPGDSPDVLGHLRDEGYSLEQLRHTARVARRHVAAWTAALVRPAAGELYVDERGDTVIDLR